MITLRPSSDSPTTPSERPDSTGETSADTSTTSSSMWLLPSRIGSTEFRYPIFYLGHSQHPWQPLQRGSRCLRASLPREQTDSQGKRQLQLRCFLPLQVPLHPLQRYRQDLSWSPRQRLAQRKARLQVWPPGRVQRLSCDLHENIFKNSEHHRWFEILTGVSSVITKSLSFSAYDLFAPDDSISMKS